jgi:DNA helicase-2/ATP-dependent DNA helicase PcrA
VKPFVKSHKNDLLDAEAIGEAVQRPTMRFVPLKTMAQLDLQAIHRLRTRLVARRTAVINQMRGFLLERGFTVPITKPVVERFRLLQEREATLEVLSGHPLANALFPDGEEWAAPLRAIVSQTYPANLGFTRGELLEEIRAGITQMETPTDVDFVRVMSLHKSKGLTAKVVVVMGCIEGMIPRIDYDEPLAEQNRSLEEQRRLFYVALTRTTETLILSSVTYIPMQSAFQMGLGINAGQASRFMGELGPTRPAAIIGQALLDSIR